MTPIPQPNPAAQPDPLASGTGEPVDESAITWLPVHWATPLMRGGLILIGVLGAIASQVVDDIIGAFAGNEGGLGWLLKNGMWIWIGAGALLVFIVGVVFFSWLFWRSIRYGVDRDAVYLRKGVISKQQRKARLDRVQSIDINQPFVPRIFGLASVKFDVAGGKNSDVTVEFLTKRGAEELRTDLLARVRELNSGRPAPRETMGAAGIDDAPAAAGASAAPANQGGRRQSSSASLVGRVAEAAAGNLEDVAGDVAQLFGHYRVRPNVQADGRLFRVSPLRILFSTLMSMATLFILLVLVAIIVCAIVFQSWIWIVSAAPGLLAGFSVQFKRIFDEANFTLRLSEDGVIVSRGLTSTVRSVIPLDRVQAVGFHQSLLWRRFGWWRVTFNTASSVAKDDGSSSSDSVILPVGTREDVLAVMALVLPNPGVPDGAALVESALYGTGENGGFRPAPVRSRIFDPWQYKRNAYRITETCVVSRRGALSRIADWVPHARVQSIGYRQGPLIRRRGLATVRLHSTQGPVTPMLLHMDAEDAVRFIADQTERGRLARAAGLNPERELAPAQEDPRDGL